MKFVKFLTRKYTLLEHCLIVESLLKKNTSISGIYYNKVIDIFQDGLVDVYVLKSDLMRNKQWVIKSVSRDPRFAEKMLKDGLSKAEKLSKLPLDLPRKISKLADKEIVKELSNLKERFFNFSGYADFTHYLGNSGIKLSKNDVERLAKFHEYRKKVLMNYFKFLDTVACKIAKNANLVR